MRDEITLFDLYLNKLRNSNLIEDYQFNMITLFMFSDNLSES